MNLSEIASVSGKSGLFKVLKPTRTGIILETIDKEKKRIIANANSRVSLLQEISIYTTDAEGSLPLKEVFQKIKDGKTEKIDLPKDDSGLFNFLESVVKNFDKEKVYASDIKKMITWYNVINEFYPEVFSAEEKEEKSEVKLDKTEKTAKASKPKAAPKTPAPKAASAKKGGGATAVKSAKRGA